jgi:hypothetical protein
MVISKETLAKIKDIIDRNYRNLTVSVLGDSVLTPEEKKALEREGVKVEGSESLLELVYNHNFINQEGTPNAPTSVQDMRAQQAIPGVVPKGEAHDYAVEHANEIARQLLDKMNQDVSTRIEGFIRDTNNEYKANALQNLDRVQEADELVKEGMVSQIKAKLRDTAGAADRDWRRIAVTEISNAIGIGSTDRIVAKNADKQLKDVYVFRIIVEDAKTCKYCRSFYQDADGSPKLYRLSTILGNGSNYGKKAADWRPTIQATHPNERCSQVIELPVGYKVLPGGKLTYIGVDQWQEYITNKLTS